VRTLLRIFAALILLVAVGVWVVNGATRGWTKTNIKHETPDPVTGLVGITYEKGFVPGVDFLAVSVVAAGVLGAASLFIKKKS
jgi:hypothetical protein